MLINPKHLADEVMEGLDNFVSKLQDDGVLRKFVNRRLLHYFHLELNQ
jgi:hypothetical protein